MIENSKARQKKHNKNEEHHQNTNWKMGSCTDAEKRASKVSAPGAEQTATAPAAAEAKKPRKRILLEAWQGWWPLRQTLFSQLDA